MNCSQSWTPRASAGQWREPFAPSHRVTNRIVLARVLAPRVLSQYPGRHHVPSSLDVENILYTVHLLLRPEQLIWVEMWGYPPWPARVSSLKSKQTFLRRLALWNSTLSFAVFFSCLDWSSCTRRELACHANILRGSSHVPTPWTCASTSSHFRSPFFRDNQSAFTYCLITSQWQLL